jgi:hypothetical protein
LFRSDYSEAAVQNSKTMPTLAGRKIMKHTIAIVTTVCSIVSLVCSSRAEANHGARADLPCPFGPGSGAWTQTATPSPFNAGVSGTVPVTLVGSLTGADAIFNQDELGLEITSAVQYDSYASAPTPPLGGCTETTTSPGPLAQVMDYGLQSGTVLGLSGGGTLTLAAGTHEIEFNYDQATASITRFQTNPGTASFTMGGVTYTSTGTNVPYVTDNDFLFDASGKLIGSLGFNEFASVIITAGAPTGWSSSGGTVSAPEMDPSSAAAAFSLLAGCAAVIRGRRRLRNAALPLQV